MNLRDAILNSIADHGDDLTIDQIEIITTAVMEIRELKQALWVAEKYCALLKIQEEVTALLGNQKPKESVGK